MPKRQFAVVIRLDSPQWEQLKAAAEHNPTLTLEDWARQVLLAEADGLGKRKD